MNIYVLTANDVTDCAGDMMESGYVVGVFDTLELAEAALAECGENYMRKSSDYSIDEFEVNR